MRHPRLIPVLLLIIITSLATPLQAQIVLKGKITTEKNEPVAFEIPMAAKKLAESGKYDAVICLGAVIRGATPHFDYVCTEASKGIAQVSMQTGVPVAFGVLTTENIQQAVERAGTKTGNKGVDCAMTAMEMVNLFKEM